MLQLLVEVKHLQYFVFVTFNLSKFFLKEVGNVCFVTLFVLTGQRPVRRTIRQDK